MSFFGKKILIGVSGGISAYKSALLVRELRKRAAHVRVMMTPSATKFVGPMTFETLSEHKVLLDLFPPEGGNSTAHIEWARWPELIVICPATANTIAKIANGIADNAVTATVLAANLPVILCPAMNKEMYLNPLYQANQKKIESTGYTIVPPTAGELACGEEGIGRLAEIDTIIEAIGLVLKKQSGPLSGKRLLVTAGPTEEPIDPVRFISNRSSGKMGFSVAERAVQLGAKVTLIAGPTAMQTPHGVNRVNVRTAAEMKAAVDEQFESCDALIMSAAVSDFRPAQVHEHKIKKNGAENSILLTRTEDILAGLAGRKGKRLVVGFSLETENEIENSKQKLERKNLDMIVLNNPLESGAGFQHDTNRVTVISREGKIEEWPLLPKSQVADRLLQKVAELLSDDS